MTRALSMVAVLAACSTSRFDDLRDRAWSDSNSAPDGVDSERYPTAIAPLSTGRPGVHFVVAGSDPASLATVSYDLEGGLDALGIPIVDVAAGVRPVLATISAPGSSSRVAVGGLGAGTIQIYDARTGAEGPALVETIDASACGGADADLGRAMVWINTHLGDAGQPDLVAVAGRELIAFPDLAEGDTSPPCVRCSQAKNIAGVAAAPLAVAPTDLRADLLVALQDPGGVENGEIAFFPATAIELDDGGTCFASGPPSVLPGNAPDYGDVLVAGDLDDNGFEEVVASVRGAGTLHVHPDVTIASQGAPFTLVATTASASFGVSIAIGDLDGDARGELIVGDPDARADGAAQTGTAFVFVAAQSGLVERVALYDATEDPGQAFGHAVGVAPFSGIAGTSELLVTGTGERLFVYFRTLEASTDPRR